MGRHRLDALVHGDDTRVGGGIVVVACAALLAGCFKRKPEEIGVTLAAGGPSSSGLAIEVDRPLHWISIHRCNPASACCDKRTTTSGHCSYDAAVPVWETAMGAHLTGRFDGVLRGSPEITGPISYGKLPAHAGWQSPATALVDGVVEFAARGLDHPAPATKGPPATRAALCRANAVAGAKEA